MSNENISFSEAVSEIEKRNNEKVDPRLEPTKNALNRLGNPEEDFEVILVGGTNGKGSTVEMISEILSYKGFKVGKYKSPYLTTIRDEFKVEDERITEEEFLELYKEVKDVDDGLTFFEFKTVLAYLYFSKENVDYAVMEVGMGGKYDATNVVDNELSVITNVGKDHTKHLGDSIEEITREIAGITPENGLLVSGFEHPVIDQELKEKSSEQVKPEKISYREGKYVYRGREFSIPIDGDFHIENLENSLKAVEKLEGLPDDIEEALSKLDNPARMEKYSEEPEIIFDGGHNPHAMRKTIEEYPESFKCIFAAVSTKDIQKMLGILEQKVSKFYFTDAGVDWAEEPERIAKNSSKPSETFSKPLEAFEAAKNDLEENETLVVTGSLYMIGNLKKSLEEK
jgi:dihydrofolate synthase/folylpolyglutamate synthase